MPEPALSAGERGRPPRHFVWIRRAVSYYAPELTLAPLAHGASRTRQNAERSSGGNGLADGLMNIHAVAHVAREWRHFRPDARSLEAWRRCHAVYTVLFSRMSWHDSSSAMRWGECHRIVRATYPRGPFAWPTGAGFSDCGGLQRCTTGLALCRLGCRSACGSARVRPRAWASRV